MLHLRIIICFKRSTFVASLETTCLHWTACLMNRCFFMQCHQRGNPEQVVCSNKQYLKVLELSFRAILITHHKGVGKKLPI